MAKKKKFMILMGVAAAFSLLVGLGSAFDSGILRLQGEVDEGASDSRTLIGTTLKNRLYEGTDVSGTAVVPLYTDSNNPVSVSFDKLSGGSDVWEKITSGGFFEFPEGSIQSISSITLTGYGMENGTVMNGLSLSFLYNGYDSYEVIPSSDVAVTFPLYGNGYHPSGFRVEATGDEVSISSISISYACQSSGSYDHPVDNELLLADGVDAVVDRSYSAPLSMVASSESMVEVTFQVKDFSGIALSGSGKGNRRIEWNQSGECVTSLVPTDTVGLPYAEDTLTASFKAAADAESRLHAHLCDFNADEEVLILNVRRIDGYASEETSGDQTFVGLNGTQKPFIYHNFTPFDQTSQNTTSWAVQAGRSNVSLSSFSNSSDTVKNAVPLAYNSDYLAYFYGGSSLSYSFSSSKNSNGYAVFKVSSGYLTHVAYYQTGNMQFNKVFSVTMNKAALAFDDDVILCGRGNLFGTATTVNPTYACVANWTFVCFPISIVEGENTLIFTSLFPTLDNDGVTPLYKDFGANGTQSSPSVDSLAIYGAPVTTESLSSVSGFTHNFVPEDQIAENDTRTPSRCFSLAYRKTALTTSSNIKKATALAVDEDYLTNFYSGAGVSCHFTSSTQGTAKVIFKIASAYFTNVQNYSIYETGNMTVNKIMTISVNKTTMTFDDSLVLKGDISQQSYAAAAMWTDIDFTINVVAGDNTITLLSLYPTDGAGALLYSDVGGVQSTFDLDTISVSLD